MTKPADSTNVQAVAKLVEATAKSTDPRVILEQWCDAVIAYNTPHNAGGFKRHEAKFEPNRNVVLAEAAVACARKFATMPWLVDELERQIAEAKKSVFGEYPVHMKQRMIDTALLNASGSVPALQNVVALSVMFQSLAEQLSITLKPEAKIESVQAMLKQGLTNSRA
jgi:uncharacterized protein (DUF2342 family)